MTDTEAQRQKEIQQAEELLFAGPQALGFAKGLFLGRFVSDWIMPYPRIPAAQQIELDKSLAEVRQFLDEDLDPTAIDRQADIPRAVIDGLGRVGVLGMTAPKEFGGHGFSQMANCRILEEIGRRCASTSLTNLASASGHRRAVGRLRFDGRAGGVRRRERADASAPERGWFALYFERGETLHYQRLNRAGLDGNGAHPRARFGQNEHNRFSGNARHAWIHHAGAAHAQTRDPRHRHGPLCPA